LRHFFGAARNVLHDANGVREILCFSHASNTIAQYNATERVAEI
jgi:hypothetical protein